MSWNISVRDNRWKRWKNCPSPLPQNAESSLNYSSMLCRVVILPQPELLSQTNYRWWDSQPWTKSLVSKYSLIQQHNNTVIYVYKPPLPERIHTGGSLCVKIYQCWSDTLKKKTSSSSMYDNELFWEQRQMRGRHEEGNGVRESWVRDTVVKRERKKQS